MARITQRLEPSALSDLLARARANVAFDDDGAAGAAPVAFRFVGGHYWIGLAAADADRLPAGRRVTLVVDDGWYWFELRAVCVQGVVEPAPTPPAGVGPGLRWLEVLPRRISAWDYGTLHEEDDGDAAR